MTPDVSVSVWTNVTLLVIVYIRLCTLCYNLRRILNEVRRKVEESIPSVGLGVRLNVRGTTLNTTETNNHNRLETDPQVRFWSGKDDWIIDKEPEMNWRSCGVRGLQKECSDHRERVKGKDQEGREGTEDFNPTQWTVRYSGRDISEEEPKFLR